MEILKMELSKYPHEREICILSVDNGKITNGMDWKRLRKDWKRFLIEKAQKRRESHERERTLILTNSLSVHF